MRCSKRTLITATCVILVFAVCRAWLDWTVMPNAAAQSESPATPRTIKKGVLFEELSRSRIEAILDEPIPDVEFHQMPLRDVLVQLNDLTGITMHFDAEELGDVIDPDVPIMIDAAAGSMTFKTLISEFVLEPNDMVFLVRENFLRVMSYEKSLTEYEIVVYDCRDLLAAPADGGSTARPLIEAIYATVRSEDSPWDDGAGTFSVEYVGSVVAIDGLLVVRQTQAMHEQVERLLELLRRANKERDRSPATSR